MMSSLLLLLVTPWWHFGKSILLQATQLRVGYGEK